MMGNWKRALAALGTALMLAAPLVLTMSTAFAQDGDASGLQGFVAAGAGLLPDYLGSKNYVPTPYFDLQLNEGNYSLRFEGSDLRLNLIDSDEFNAGPLVGFRLGRGHVHEAAVSNLYHIPDSLTAGGFVEWEHQHQDPRSAERLTLLAADDVTNEYTGWNVTLRGVIRRPVEFVDPGLIASLEADANWGSSDYMQNYFAITPANAFRSGLPVYHAAEGISSVGAAFSLDQFLSRKWSVGLRFHYARLTGSATDSPVVRDVGSPNQFFAGVVVGYVI